MTTTPFKPLRTAPAATLASIGTFFSKRRPNLVLPFVSARPITLDQLATAPPVLSGSNSKVREAVKLAFCANARPDAAKVATAMRDRRDNFFMMIDLTNNFCICRAASPRLHSETPKPQLGRGIRSLAEIPVLVKHESVFHKNRKMFCVEMEPPAGRPYMCSMTLAPNSLHLISVSARLSPESERNAGWGNRF